MEQIEILYYRKLKKTPRVFLMDLQVSATLDLENEPYGAFFGVTSEHTLDICVNIYYGQLETSWHPSNRMDCELEVCEEEFVDNKKYTPEEVANIMHPIFWMDFTCGEWSTHEIKNENKNEDTSHVTDN